jgi:hypothetical protein
MYTLEPTGIWVAGDFGVTKLIPYEEIIGISKISLAESIITGWNLLKPGLSEAYMGVEGDPLHVMMIEPPVGRYLMRGDDIDDFIAKANDRLRAFRASGGSSPG